MREMKDSGIEWIGEMPIGWETRKIKHIATLNGRIGWQGLTSNEYCDNGAYLITGVNFNNGHIDWSTCVHVPMERWAEAPQIQIQNGDLLITKDGTVGKVAIVSNMSSETSLNSGVLLIRTVDSCYKKYLFWILQSEIFWKWFNTINTGNSTIIHLYQYDFCNFSFPFPEYSLQCKIADYLDCKCSQIDAIIARQQEVIEKLKAYKLSVITEVVTKGLNPDVPMKDSGVEWIGEIPEHWENRKMISILSMRVVDGPHESPELYDEGIPYISATAIENGKINFDLMRGYISEEYCDICDLRYKPQLHDILVIKLGASTGQVAIVETTDRFNIWVPLAAVRCNEKADPYFVYYAFQSDYFLKQMEMSWTYGTQQTLGVKSIERLRIMLPTLEEQKEIVGYLKSKCDSINIAVRNKENIIQMLADYKKSLIYEVVTGKKEV